MCVKLRTRNQRARGGGGGMESNTAMQDIGSCEAIEGTSRVTRMTLIWVMRIVSIVREQNVETATTTSLWYKF